MADNVAEKIHDPTLYRREQARARGQVARSRELESAGVLLCGIAALLWLGRDAAECLARLGGQLWGGNAWLAADPEFVANFWRGLAPQLARAVVPILGLVALGAGFLQLLETGWLFRPARALPDWSRIDPARGLARLWSLERLFVAVFAMLKIALIGAVVGWCVYAQRGEILRLTGLEAALVAPLVCELLLKTALKTGGALLGLAILDYGFQWWRHEQSMKLSAAELREEQRDLQPNPEIASRRRALQRDASSRRAAGTAARHGAPVTSGESHHSLAGETMELASRP
ncbi:MAG: EscU/YscU/HrcU family type III secretion system export apparatus switch protein [Pirellulales bacterium]